jgi:hypothetical protein
MEKQTSSEHPLDIVPLWMRIAFGGFCSLAGILGIWKHGLKDWDWLWSVFFLGMIIQMGRVPGPLGRNLRWPLRVVWALSVIAVSAGLAHFWGWVPAVAFAGISFVAPGKEKGVSWKAYLRKPQNVIVALLTLVLIVWFAREIGGWVPTTCVVLTFLLLEGYTTARRRLRDNFRRRSFAALASIAMFAAIWASLHPSFGNFAGLVFVVVLVSSDIYFHTEEAPSIHISQPRS